VVGATRTRNANALFPLVLYLHPTHGLVFEGWIAQNDAMLRVLASRGFVVCAPTIVGARDGRGPDSPVVGGLFPGEQHTAAVIERRVYPRLLAFAPRAAAHLVRMSLAGSPSDLSHDSGHSTRPSSNRSSALSFPESLARVIDPSRIAFAGFSSGAALAIYAADAAEQTWPGATRAVVALAPTIGDFDFARTQFEGRAKRINLPMLLVAGTEDGMGGLEGLVELGDAATNAPPRRGRRRRRVALPPVHPRGERVRLVRRIQRPGRHRQTREVRGERVSARVHGVSTRRRGER
jgi:dienelactone hydrolase